MWEVFSANLLGKQILFWIHCAQIWRGRHAEHYMFARSIWLFSVGILAHKNCWTLHIPTPIYYKSKQFKKYFCQPSCTSESGLIIRKRCNSQMSYQLKIGNKFNFHYHLWMLERVLFLDEQFVICTAGTDFFVLKKFNDSLI